MKAVRFKTPMTTGRIVEAVGYPTGVPGLVVTDGGCGHWIVSHVRSGLGVAACQDSPETALHYALQLGPHADWTVLTGREVEDLMGKNADVWSITTDMKIHGNACYPRHVHGPPCFDVDNEVV